MNMDFNNELLDAWSLNNKVTLYLFENIEPKWLEAKNQGKGRSVGEQFVHINNIRSYWIGKVDRKEDLKIDKKYQKDKERLVTSLNITGDRMTKTLESILNQGKIKGYKPHPLAFYSQMISHESHHRGQIMMTITRNELPISKTVNFGIWNWNNK